MTSVALRRYERAVYKAAPLNLAYAPLGYELTWTAPHLGARRTILNEYLRDETDKLGYGAWVESPRKAVRVGNRMKGYLLVTELGELFNMGGLIWRGNVSSLAVVQHSGQMVKGWEKWVLDWDMEEGIYRRTGEPHEVADDWFCANWPWEWCVTTPMRAMTAVRALTKVTQRFTPLDKRASLSMDGLFNDLTRALNKARKMVEGENGRQ